MQLLCDIQTSIHKTANTTTCTNRKQIPLHVQTESRSYKSRETERSFSKMEARSSLPFLGFRRRTLHCVAMHLTVKALCRERALKRWSALLTQTESRIGFKCGMRKRLGEANFKAFVKYAEAHYKEVFVRGLTPTAGMLCCGGKIRGEACPKDIQINLQTVPLPELKAMLPRMLMDHKHDVAHICDVWSRALPA